MRADVAGARAAERGGRKVGYPIKIRELEVLRAEQLAPRMRRITLGGPGVAGFQSHAPIEHVKLIFPDTDSGEVRLPVEDGDRLNWPRPYPTGREYSVRRHDAAAGEIDIDLVIHPGGLASGWAQSAVPGDRIPVAGPPGGMVISEGYDRYLLVGDETALPPIARWLEEAAPEQLGTAVIEVATAEDRLALHHPPGFEVKWIFRDGGPSRDGRRIAAA